jgi:DNA-binding Lrp family transcriptional regulator
METPREEKPKPRVAPEPRPLASAFVFIRGENDVDMYDIYSKLNFADGVCYCDPVVGDWDMVILIQATGRKEIDELVRRHVEPLNGIEAFEVHHCEKPKIPKEFEAFIRDYEKAQAMERADEGEMDSRNTRMLTSYAVLDLDPSVFSNLYMKLYFTDNVVHCDVTDGGRHVVLFLQGISTQEVQSVIRNQIRLMPGVLRIKQLNALNFSTK